jgi:hypothetical protein
VTAVGRNARVDTVSPDSAAAPVSPPAAKAVPAHHP